ncbi:hypothetical protein GCM10010452_04530 [Crossiella cryophila]
MLTAATASGDPVVVSAISVPATITTPVAESDNAVVPSRRWKEVIGMTRACHVASPGQSD